jgi:hypothetical protein
MMYQMAVASRDRKLLGRVPDKDRVIENGAWNWHPKNDVLAWAAQKQNEGPYSLYIWDIQS